MKSNIEKFHKKVRKLFPTILLVPILMLNIIRKDKKIGLQTSLFFKLGEKEFLLLGNHTIGININSLGCGNVINEDAYYRYRVLHCSVKPKIIYKIIKDMKKINDE